jgi:beta-alanine--pyruvate transaminase
VTPDHTYSGHPVACAAGVAALDIYEGDGLFTLSNAPQARWCDAIHALNGARDVIDIRTLGLIAGIQLSSRDGSPRTRAYDAFTGDIVALSPPLIVEGGQIDRIVSNLGDASAAPPERGAGFRHRRRSTRSLAPAFELGR